MSEDKWCPENDAAYRAELAAIHGNDNTARLRARIDALETQLKAADELAEAVDAMPYKHSTAVIIALAAYRAAKEASHE